MIFNASDIQWVKNVKNPTSNHLTYMDEYPNDSFPLHWSKNYVSGKEAEKANIGELILMYQRPHNVTYLTHLVTPVNSKYVDCRKTNPEYPWGREVVIVARATAGIPAPLNISFSSVNQGHCYRIDSIDTKEQDIDVQAIIWNAFQPYMVPELELARIIDVPDVAPELYALEGIERMFMGMHRFRERNPVLVQRKKNEAISQNKLFCACCNFNFALAYPEHGDGFIECHHNKPINQGERITTLDDLALVCSNCHRMLHRKNKSGAYYTVAELSKIIQK
jgi:hypothetical protein